MDIKKYGPCNDGLKYYNSHPSFRSAWKNCERGDWMLWIAWKLEVDIKVLTRAKALCAKTVEHLMEDERSVKAIEVALKFSEGKATREELANAADAAAAAAAAADAAAAASYASADYASAAAAADAASSASAAAAASAASAAAAADYASAAAAARATGYKKNQKQTANICREVLTEYVLEKIHE